MKSWLQRERARETLAKETGYVQKPHGDRLRIALAFPNTYWVGMSNLGFQTVYTLFNSQPDIVCERVFLPPKQELAELLASRAPLLTLESQSPVSDFDVFAFSVSFEWDYVNVLTLMRLAGLPRYAAERNERHPLVVIGGAVTFALTECCNAPMQQNAVKSDNLSQFRQVDFTPHSGCRHTLLSFSFATFPGAINLRRTGNRLMSKACEITPQTPEGANSMSRMASPPRMIRYQEPSAAR